MAPLKLVQYSEKSIAVYGDLFTTEQKEFFDELQGLYNGRLRDGPGYIFKNAHKGTLEKYLSGSLTRAGPAANSLAKPKPVVKADEDDERELPKLLPLLKRSNAQTETQLDRIESLLKNILTRVVALESRSSN
jgi:hypothetical protein